MRKRLLMSATMALLAVTTVGGVAAVPAMASGNALVIAGDSFAVGEGGIETGPYLAGSDTPTNQCHRSASSAAAVFAMFRPFTVQNVGCSGATTANITSAGQFGELPQAQQIDQNARKVVVMVGGNDIGFGTIVGCLLQTDCDQTPVPAGAFAAIAALGPKLDSAYDAIRAAAPNASVTVMLYPRLLPASAASAGPNCPYLNAAEIGLGNSIQTATNAVIAYQAWRHGFRVAIPSPGFVGHDVCSTTPFFYPPGTVPPAATWHPNYPGRVAMAASLVASA